MRDAQGFSGGEINQVALPEMRLGQDAGDHAVRSALENEALKADVGRHDMGGRGDFLAEVLS